ncbi:hypothetical protein GCM10010517_14720 [Streptosporangium fragile]|uniref:Uncharacterized protein n=1 Tax=Streptosporangium fragile TaxID=46186 RepID=A0ABP6IB42_9ACTN
MPYTAILDAFGSGAITDVHTVMINRQYVATEEHMTKLGAHRKFLQAPVKLGKQVQDRVVEVFSEFEGAIQPDLTRNQ